MAKASAVHSREDLVEFLGLLKEDFLVNGTAWTNSSLTSYLEAMAAWAADMDGFYARGGENIANVSPWRVLVDVLMAARTYE